MRSDALKRALKSDSRLLIWHRQTAFVDGDTDWCFDNLNGSLYQSPLGSENGFKSIHRDDCHCR